MFSRTNQLNSDRIDRLVVRIECLEARKLHRETVACEECGCLVFKSDAMWSEPSVKVRKEFEPFYGYIDKEYIHRDYFCKLHAPKGK